MGSSEFEFGALPKSLRRMTSSFSEYVWFPIEDIKDADGQCLYVLCRKKQKDEIVDAIKIIAVGEHITFRTKERVGLYDYITCNSEYSMRNNFWWDVTSTDCVAWKSSEHESGNDWMACFGNNIRPLVIAIYKVCAKHKVPKLGDGPSIPIKSSLLIRPEFTFDNDLKKRDTIIISYPDGRSTVILKRKIVNIDDQDDQKIKVLIQTKSGTQKWIEINIGLSSTRSLLLNILKDWPKINNLK
jgi:hypothetical protein